MPEVPPTAGPLIGRDQELATLSDLVGIGRDAGGSVLLAGDAGVGKTRLLAELQGRAGQAGWRVLVGHCLDFAGDGLPYLPFREILGQLAGQAPELVNELLAARPALAWLLPGAGRQITEHSVRRLAGPGRSPNPLAGDPLAGPDRRAGPDSLARPDRLAGTDGGTGTGRPELFEAVRDALDRLGRAGRVLLVVEDLHWADTSTRELLSFLFTRDRAAGSSLVASYRSDDLHRRHPLRPYAAQWARLRTVTRVHLAPLPDQDVRALIGALQPAGLSEVAVAGIVSRAEGNAFFTEELVSAAGRGEQVLPTDLTDLLLLHLDELEEQARQVLQAISVAGRRVSHELLARVVGPDGLVLDQALRAAVDRNLLVTRSGSYAFRHALLAEAVYDDLLPGERVRWHRNYCAALQSGVVQGSAAELARHAKAAHDLPTAISAGIRAGDDAMSVGGPAEASRHYEQVLELLAERPSPGSDAPVSDAPVSDAPVSDAPVSDAPVSDVAVSDDNAASVAAAASHDTAVEDLVLRAAESAIAAGWLHRALALLQNQLAALPTNADPLRRVRLLHAVASTALLDDAPIDALELTTEALRLMPAEQVNALRAQVLAVHARANANRGRTDDAVRWAVQATELARQLQLPAVLADATTTLARSRNRDPEQAEREFRASTKNARAAGDAATELRSTHNLGTLLYGLGRLTDARTAFELAAGRAAELRRPWAPYGLDGRSMTAVVSYTLGEWDLARRVVEAAGESAPPLARATLDAVGLAVSAGRGDASALEGLPGLRPWWDRDGFLAITCAAAAIDLFGDSGDLDAAIAVHDDAVTLVAALWAEPDFQARIRLSGLLLGQLTQRATHVGAHERAGLIEYGQQLYDAAARAAEAVPQHGPESVAWLSRVAAEYGRLRWLAGAGEPDPDGLVQAWRAAVEAFVGFGHAFEVARSRARLAAVLRAQGRPDQAAPVLALAVDTARALGATPLLRELRALGVSAEPARTSVTPLTGREREVLALVAQGRSNGDIARLLFISPKTVSVHVSNILAKLHAVGRTEAVDIARRRGLLAIELPAGGGMPGWTG